jgi:hypothetical protein
MEHSSAAAYIEGLVERDLQAHEEASRVIQIHVAAGLPDQPAGKVTRAEGETQADHEARAALLDSLSVALHAIGAFNTRARHASRRSTTSDR